MENNCLFKSTGFSGALEVYEDHIIIYYRLGRTKHIIPLDKIVCISTPDKCFSRRHNSGISYIRFYFDYEKKDYIKSSDVYTFDPLTSHTFYYHTYYSHTYNPAYNFTFTSVDSSPSPYEIKEIMDYFEKVL